MMSLYQWGVGLDDYTPDGPFTAMLNTFRRPLAQPEPLPPPEPAPDAFATATAEPYYGEPAPLPPPDVPAWSPDPVAAPVAPEWQAPSLPPPDVAGPAGRSVNQITGTDYLSDAERDWWRSQQGLAPAPAFNQPQTYNAPGAFALPESGGSPFGPLQPVADWAMKPIPALQDIRDTVGGALSQQAEMGVGPARGFGAAAEVLNPVPTSPLEVGLELIPGIGTLPDIARGGRAVARGLGGAATSYADEALGLGAGAVPTGAVTPSIAPPAAITGEGAFPRIVGPSMPGEALPSIGGGAPRMSREELEAAQRAVLGEDASTFAPAQIDTPQARRDLNDAGAFDLDVPTYGPNARLTPDDMRRQLQRDLGIPRPVTGTALGPEGAGPPPAVAPGGAQASVSPPATPPPAGGAGGAPPALPGATPEFGALEPPKPARFNVVDEVIGALGLPQTSMATLDVSAIGRQAQVLGWSNPREWKDAAVAGVKAFASDDAARVAREVIESDPVYPFLKKIGLHYYGFGDEVVDAGERVPGFTGLNKSAVSRFVGNLPGVKNSERAYATTLNVEGHDVARKYAEAMWEAGDKNLQHYKDLAAVINHARGYGSFNPLQIAQGFNAFFSGRNLVSRFEVLLDPFIRSGSLLEPSARQLAAKNMASFIAGNTALLGFLGVTGGLAGGAWTVNADPRESDFAKIKIGNTRIDTLAGFGPIVRLISRVGAEGSDASLGTNLARPYDEWRQEVVRFFSNKQSPVAALLTEAITDKDWRGQPAKFGPERLAEMFTPFLIGEVVEAYKNAEGSPLERGALAAGVGAVSAFGAGSSSYPPTPATALRDVFKEETGLEYDSLLPHERDPLIASRPALSTAAQTSMDKATSESSRIAKQKYDSLSSISGLATTDPAAYRAAAGDISARAAIQYEEAKRTGAIKEFSGPQAEAYKALDGYYAATEKARDPLTGRADYDLQEKLEADYLNTLEPEMRQRILNEISYSKDPTYREYKQSRQRLSGYFDAPDTSFELAKKLAGQTPEGSAQRLVLQFDSLTALRSSIEETLRKAGVAQTQIDSGRQKIEDSIGLTNLTQAARKFAIQQDPGAVLDLERWYGAPKYIRDFAAELVRTP